MHKFIILFLMISSLNLFTQNNRPYSLKNIVETKIKVNYTDFNDNSYKMCYSDSFVFIYNISFDEDNYLKLLKINVYNNAIDTVRFFYPNLSDKIKNPFLNFINSDGNLFIFYTSNNNLLIYDNNNLIYDTIIDKCSYDDSKINGNYIYFYSTYNYHKLNCTQNTRISLFNIKSKLFLKDTFLNNPYKEFTHYSPNNFITINNKNEILFTNSVENKIYKFDSLLKLKNIINLKNKNWNQFPDVILKSFYKNNKNRNPKEIIEFLDKFENKYNRIERLYWVSDTSFMIVIIPINHLNLNHKREYMLCNISNLYNITFKSIFNEEEDLTNKNIILTDNNFPIQSSSGFNSFFNNKFYFRLFPYCKNKKLLNLTNKNIENNIEKCYELDLIYYLLIYIIQ